MATADQALEALRTMVGEQRQSMQAIAQMTTGVQTGQERLTQEVARHKDRR